MAPTASTTHPLVDTVGDGFVASYSAASVLGLTEGRMGLLADAARQSQRVLIVTGPHARLSFALAQYLQQLGGQWLIQGEQGLRLAATGRQIEQLADAFDVLPASAEPRSVVGRAGAAPTGGGAARWLQFTVSVNHTAREETLLGRTVGFLAEQIAGEQPSGWGANEPAGIHWNRENVTRFVRGRMPRETRLVLSGGSRHPFSATMHVFRSAIGVTEETKILVALGTDRVQSDAVVDRVPAVLAQLSTTQQVLFGLAFEQHGWPDATFAPFPARPMSPLAAVIGARAVRELELGTDEVVARLGAKRTGSARAPSLVVPVGTGADADAAERWRAFAQGIGTIGVPQLRAALGIAGHGSDAPGGGGAAHAS